jgi:hypothetical protein
MPSTAERLRAQYHERKDAGLCVECGAGEPHPGSVKCSGCLTKKRAYRRSYDGCRPWHPGGPGRPPLTTDSAPAAGEHQVFPSWIERGRARYGLPR